ncbi:MULTISPECIES: hypothetical protein [unclassified Francisella]|uniref:hypothetical protein n=1 Tax=unclassified Francisella TaxID=2610885 RepID=UPI002E36609F|nr:MULTISPECIES: hypothetical protein [unclassified Francisella]MED7819120.1 hypothetical protein [Francisella sp. 19S2-4]MED7829920.1 hypothetical protein [Francisella sp. 19S2-10]
MTNNKEDNLKEVETILGTPFECLYDEKDNKIRTKLLAFSFITIIFKWFKLNVSSDSSFIGIKISGLSNQIFDLTLFILVSYFLIIYIITFYEKFTEWKIRLTGTRLIFSPYQSGTYADGGHDCKDHHNDPRQSTLYNWIQQRFILPKDFQKNLNKLEKKLEDPNCKITLEDINKIKYEITSLKSSYDNFYCLLENPRLEVSLKRFDNWFKYFNKLQNWRWLIIDSLLPVLLGVIAIIMLFK